MVKISRIVLLAAFVLVALPTRAVAGDLYTGYLYVYGLTADRQVVWSPSPITTRMRVAVVSPDPWCGAPPYPPVKMYDHTIDISFPMVDPCFLGTPPPNGNWGYFGYLPAGTYLARLIHISPEGVATVDETLTFEVVEAGPPLDIPALSTTTLGILAILLIVIALKRLA